MKRKTSLILSMMLIVAMILSLSLVTFATETVYDLSVDGDESITAVYDSETKTITITGLGEIKDYTSSDAPFRSIVSSVEHVNIGEGITRIGSYTFYGNNSGGLTKTGVTVSLPSTLTVIGAYAFNKLAATSITIPANVTDIAQYAFNYATMSGVEFENGSKLSYIGYRAFKNSSITRIILPEGLQTIVDEAFYNCTSLYTLSVPKSVTNFGKDVFYNCRNVKAFTFLPESSANIPDNFLNNVGSYATEKTAIVDADNFYMIKALESIGFTVSTVDDDHLDRFASYPSNLKYQLGENVYGYLNLINGEMIVSGVGAMTDFDTAYQGSPVTPIPALTLEKIKSLVIEDGVTTIGIGAFRKYYSSSTICSLTNCTSISLPSSLTKIGSVCGLAGAKFTSIVIPKNVEEIGGSVFGSALENVEFEDDSKLKTIGASAFSKTKITSIVIPNGVETIGANAFSSCSLLTSVVLPNTVTTIGNGAFNDDTKLSNFVFEVNTPDLNNNIVNASTGKNATNKTARIGANQVYLKEILEYNGYEVTTVGSKTITDIEAYPEGAVYTYGDNVKGLYNSVTKTLRLIGNGPTYDFVDYGGYGGKTCPMGYSLQNVKKIIVEEGITRLGTYCFYTYGGYQGGSSYYYYLSAVTEVELPSTLESMGNAFLSAGSLVSVNIPQNMVEIGSGAFSGCRSLTEINIPKSVTTIGSSAFNGCSSLATLNIEQGSNLSTIGSSAFAGTALVNVDLPNTITSVGTSAFSNCKKVKTFSCETETIGAFSSNAFSSGSSAMGYSATGKTATINANQTYLKEGLETLGYIVNTTGTKTVSEFDTYPESAKYKIGDNITGYFNSISGTFYVIGTGETYDYWRNYVIDNVATSEEKKRDSTPLTDILSSIKKVVVDEGVTRLGDFLFNYSYAVSSGHTGEYKMSNCTTIELPSTLKSIGKFTFAYTSSLTSITIPANVEEIRYAAFSGASKMTSVSVESGSKLKEIGSSAFSSCSKLASVELSSKMDSIGDNAFYNCSELTSISLPSGITTIQAETFKNCSKLASVSIPSSVKTIGDSAFYGCTVLNTTIPNGVETIGSKAFYSCKGLTTVNIPDSVTSLGTEAFSNCSNITSVDLSENITVIPKQAFMSCSKLANITIPEGTIRIDEDAFEYDTKLSAINLPEGLETIGQYAFYGDSALTSVIIPASVDSIGQRAFYNCSNLATVYDLSKESQTVGDYAFATSSKKTDAYLYSTNTGLDTQLKSRNSYIKTMTYLDEEDYPTSGDLPNGVHWEYDSETHTLSFSGEGEVPAYENGSQPWYSAATYGGGVGNYSFSEGITNIHTGLFGYYGGSSGWGYGGNYGGVSTYSGGGSSGALASAISSYAQGATQNDLPPSPTTPTDDKEIIKVYVDGNEVEFIDVQPRVKSDVIYAPLRFIFQDLGATVLWNQEDQAVIIQKLDDEKKKEIVLRIGSNIIEVNGKEYDVESYGIEMPAVVEFDNGRCLLPGEAIVMAWNTVRFSDEHNAPSSYKDYYYRDSYTTENKFEDIPEIDEYSYSEDNSVVITEDNITEIEAEMTENNGQTMIILDATPTIFKAVVPIKVNINQYADGTVEVLGDYSIANLCPAGPILITDINVVVAPNWSLVDNSSDFKNMKADSQNIALTINSVDVAIDGSIEMNDSLSSSILHDESKELTFTAQLPARKTAYNGNIAAFVFTLDFDKI